MASKRRWDLLILGIASVLFFLSSLFLVIGVPRVFNSPDENANAKFAETMRTQSRLTIDEPINLELGGTLHPRSVVAVGPVLAPGSFLGLPLVYGLIGKVTGASFVLFLTPLLAVLSIFAWRAVVERIFGSRPLALIASLAVLFHPGFWYYSGRMMMHNVPMVAFAIFVAYFFLLRPFKQAWLNPTLAGFFIALAIWFRGFEALWIIPAAAVLLIVYWGQTRGSAPTRTHIALFIVAAIVTLIPLLIVNNQIYEAPFATGYTPPPSTVVVAPAPDPEQAEHFSLFAFDLKSTLKNAWHYSVELFPWMSFAAALGFLAFVGREWKKSQPLRVYAVLTVAVTAWLWLVYGSWNFNDNPDPNVISLGTSYVRYWLPIFILISPFVAEFILWLSARVKFALASRIVIATLVIAMIGLNIHPVFFAEDGLVSIRQNLFAFAATRDAVLEQTEDDAIIIVDRADKFLWPERRVVHPLRSETTYASMPGLAKAAPLYYFGITFPPQDIAYLNGEKLPPLGLQIEHVETIGEESLYRLYEIR